MGEAYMCPECGWTGMESNLDAGHECPACGAHVDE
jgi:predicted RNA-binding Zn-ribbon protein involved in translation (DUF1610 family)